MGSTPPWAGVTPAPSAKSSGLPSRGFCSTVRAYAFPNEATSALDIANEQLMYEFREDWNSDAFIC
jgi:hypothetical protein